MAFMSQERKAEIAPNVKKILSKHGLNGSLSVRDHSTLVLKIKSGSIDFIKNYHDTMLERQHGVIEPWQLAKEYIDVNVYHYGKEFTGPAREALHELVEAMNKGNHDNSNPMVDYFDVGWYVTIQIGSYVKAYEYELEDVMA
jgi:hypothetical protein